MTTPEATKKCTKCGRFAPLGDFYRKNSWCRGCKRAYYAKWREGNAEHREKVREWGKLNKDRINGQRRKKRHHIPNYALAERIRDKYGLRLADYNDMLVKSGGLCGICRSPTSDLCIDHDHSTGQVRELLCRSCNQGLGQFMDDIAKLEAAIAYLKRHGKS